MFSFLTDYAKVVVELSRLLDLQFVQSSPGLDTRVGKAITGVLVYWNRQEQEKARWELHRLAFLVKHLAEVEAYDKALFELFKKQFRSGKLGRDGYFGLRFEVNIAASLIRKRLQPKKRESPDFEVAFAPEIIYIECGSTHSSPGKEADFWQKLGVAMDEKQRKPYAGQGTCLFLDITNVYSTTLSKGRLPDYDFMKRELGRMLELARPGYGSVILFMIIFNKERNGIESDYIRVDSRTATKTLVQFLDSTFPVSYHTVADYALPSEP